jgi:4-aminobutyrate aminotransferase-like enzyme
MLGAELAKPNGEPDGQRAIAIVKAALRAGIILLADGPDSNVLGLSPPFAIDDAEIGFVADALAKLLREIS